MFELILFVFGVSFVLVLIFSYFWSVVIYKLAISKKIESFYTLYKELTSKAEQIAATEELVVLWAKTAKEYKELDNPIQKVKINISSVANGTSQSAINELIKRAEAGEITLSDGVKISA